MLNRDNPRKVPSIEPDAEEAPGPWWLQWTGDLPFNCPEPSNTLA